MNLERNSKSTSLHLDIYQKNISQDLLQLGKNTFFDQSKVGAKIGKYHTIMFIIESEE